MLNRRIVALVTLPLLGLVTGCPSTAPDTSGTQAFVKGLALPAGANALVTVKAVTTHMPSGTAKSNENAVDAEVVIDSAMLVVRDIKLKPTDTDPNDMSSDPNDMLSDPNDMMDDPNDMHEDDGEDQEGDHDGDDDEGEHDEYDAFKLVGPFLVDLVSETTENLGLSNIDNDADDDGVKDKDDSDDDGDGVNDDADDDDDNDGVGDEEDQDVDESTIFDAVALPPGTYRHIKFKTHPLEGENFGLEDHPMDGLTALVTGTIDGVPFLFRTRFDENFHFKSQTGIDVMDGEISTFLLTIDVASWFSTIDVSQADLEDDGSILIDASQRNSGLAEQVRRRIKETTHVGSDDHDGDERGGKSDDDGDDNSDSGSDS